MVAFQFTRLYNSPIDAIYKAVLSENAYRFVKDAINHSAIVAGGFARRFLLHTDVVRDLATEHKKWRPGESNHHAYRVMWRDLERYLGCHRERLDEIHSKVRDRGDIDLFFEDPVGLDKFVNTLSRRQGVRQLVDAVGEDGTLYREYALDDKIRSQIIMKTVQPVWEHLERFDLYNAMVGFNEREAWVPDGWHALEATNTLHVQNWGSPYAISRITKWFQNHGYKQLSPMTASEIGTEALKILERLKKEQIKHPAFDSYVTYDDMLRKLRPFFPHMSSDQLLLMMTVVPAHVVGKEFDGYSYDTWQTPLDVLRSRGAVI